MPNRLCTCGGIHPAGQPCPNRKRPARFGRATRQQRGYDATYDRNRRTLIAQALAHADAGQPIPCPICALPCLRGQSLTAEHIVPIRAGGSSELANLQPSHAACNYGWSRTVRGQR